MHAHTTTYHEIQYKDRPIYVVYSRLNQNLLIKYTILELYSFFLINDVKIKHTQYKLRVFKCISQCTLDEHQEA
jgi:hypothetical protein